MKKLRSKKGFTLTEMLISVLLLGFVSIMVTVMTSAILNSTATMREVAQAEILGSEALDNLQGQLRVVSNLTVESGNVTFDLDRNNTGYTLTVKDGKIVMGMGEGGVLSDEGNPLFAGSSYGNLTIEELKFSLSESKTSVVISVSIAYGDNTLWSGSVTVKPLNGIKTT